MVDILDIPNIINNLYYFWTDYTLLSTGEQIFYSFLSLFLIGALPLLIYTMQLKRPEMFLNYDFIIKKNGFMIPLYSFLLGCCFYGMLIPFFMISTLITEVPKNINLLFLILSILFGFLIIKFESRKMRKTNYKKIISKTIYLSLMIILSLSLFYLISLIIIVYRTNNYSIYPILGFIIFYNLVYFIFATPVLIYYNKAKKSK